MDAILEIQTLATDATSMVWLFAGNFLVLLILTVLMILFSYKGGKGGIISLILAFYMGYALYMVFPYTEQIISAGGTTIVKGILSLGLFVGASIPPFIFIQRLIGGGFGVLSFLPRFVLSFLAAAFLLALAYHAFDVSNIYSFPEPMDKLFAPEGLFFYWFIAPLLGLLFLVH